MSGIDTPTAPTPTNTANDHRGSVRSDATQSRLSKQLKKEGIGWRKLLSKYNKDEPTDVTAHGALGFDKKDTVGSDSTPQTGNDGQPSQHERSLPRRELQNTPVQSFLSSTDRTELSTIQDSDSPRSVSNPLDEKQRPPPRPPSPQDSEYDNPNEPPPLKYTLRTRKASIVFFWSLILIDSIAIPLVLYFTLQYHTDLTPNAVFSISTGCLGGISIVEYILRFWRLWKHSSQCRVVGARRWYLDWFHWNFSIAWVYIMVELIIGTAFDNPPIRLLAMPCASLLWWFAFEMLIMDAMRILGYRAPLRISSIPKGEPLRPGIYPIIEDVCAVDGSGGTEFRLAFNKRFESSHYFRLMLHRLTLFWAFGCLGCAILTTVLVFVLEPDTSYVVGWVVPFVWAGIWILITFPYVKWHLRLEKEKWAQAKSV